MSTAVQRRDVRIALWLLVCVVLVIFWQVASYVASRPFEALRLDGEHFAAFLPASPHWTFKRVHAKATPTEPTILVYEANAVLNLSVPSASVGAIAKAPVLVRLVHGYNMVDCMRIKQYEVALMEDRRYLPLAPPIQIWSLTAPDGRRTLWITSMLRMTDFCATSVDPREMAFPRVGTPDDPGWAPSGLTWSSLRHPIRNGELFLRSKWNAARADWLTFLRLRQPAWASDVMLTLVSEFRGEGSVDAESSQAVRDHVMAVHHLMLQALAAYGEAFPVTSAP